MTCTSVHVMYFVLVLRNQFAGTCNPQYCNLQSADTFVLRLLVALPCSTRLFLLVACFDEDEERVLAAVAHFAEAAHPGPESILCEGTIVEPPNDGLVPLGALCMFSVAHTDAGALLALLRPELAFCPAHERMIALRRL